MKRLLPTLGALALGLLGSCMSTQHSSATFGDDLEFLRQYKDVVVLSDAQGKAQIAVVPAYQARVMTSTADGESGASYGWVNRELIGSGQTQPHINAYGGEDRFWIGPEGGQYSVFFSKGAPFDLEHWFTPPAIDTTPFELVRKERDRALFQKRIELDNYAGTPFTLDVMREVRLRDAADALSALDVQAPASVHAVAFESINTITNGGKHPWHAQAGLVSIWILGMLNATPETTVVIPFVSGPDAKLGPVVNDRYFGKVPSDRLVVKDDVLFFRGDAEMRSKIGISPRRAKPVLGSFDGKNGVLTLVEYTLPAAPHGYVNAMWELQQEPFGGDAVNSYNDGPSKPGAKQLGKFYELESSSPALALEAGKSATHVHRTIHLAGSDADLDPIARKVLGVSIAEIRAAFGG